MLFFSFSYADIDFKKIVKKFIQELYTIIEALPITKRIEFINKIEFAKVILDTNFKTLFVYVATLESLLKAARIVIYLFQLDQIPAKIAQIVTL